MCLDWLHKDKHDSSGRERSQNGGCGEFQKHKQYSQGIQMSPVTGQKVYVARPVARGEVDMSILGRGVTQTLSCWLQSCLQLDRWYSFSIAWFLVSSWLSLSAPPTFSASDLKESKTVLFLWSVYLICSEQRKPFPPILQSYSIIFVDFVIKIWKKRLGNKNIFIFFDTFIKSPWYSLIAGKIESPLSGPLFLLCI